MRRKLLRLALSLGILAGAVLAYKSYLAWSFESHLATFRVSMVREGMPGSPRTETIIASDGLLQQYKTSAGKTQLVAELPLDANTIGQLRNALRGLRTMRGPYWRPLWDREPGSAANYLDFDIQLSNGTTRYFSLHNVNPDATRRFLQAFNGSVPEECRIYYRND